MNNALNPTPAVPSNKALIAYKTYQCDKYLYTSEHPRVFQHVVVAVIVAWILHISYLADAKVQQKF